MGEAASEQLGSRLRGQRAGKDPAAVERPRQEPSLDRPRHEPSFHRPREGSGAGLGGDRTRIVSRPPPWHGLEGDGSEGVGALERRGRRPIEPGSVELGGEQRRSVGTDGGARDGPERRWLVRVVDLGGEDFGRVGADVAEGVAQTLVEWLGEDDGKVMAVAPAAGMAVVVVVVGGEANRDLSESVAHGKVGEEERETMAGEKLGIQQLFQHNTKQRLD